MSRSRATWPTAWGHGSSRGKILRASTSPRPESTSPSGRNKRTEAGRWWRTRELSTHLQPRNPDRSNKQLEAADAAAGFLEFRGVDHDGLQPLARKRVGDL